VPLTSQSPPIITQARGLSLALGQGGGGGEASGGTAALAWSLASEAEGSTLTITTDGTFDFGTKPIASKPRFVWLADGGEAPDTTLGRATEYARGNGVSLGDNVATTEIVAEGQSQSYVADHNLGQIMLQPVDAGTQRKKLVFRRRYEDFDIETAKAIRVRVSAPLESGVIPAPGDLVTGQQSGATGVIERVDDETANGRWSFFFLPSGGSVNQNQPTDFMFGEQMTWASGQGVNAEGSAEFPTGTFRTFNNKTIRFWSEPPENGTNTYLGDGRNVDSSAQTKITVEHGSGSVNNITDTYVQSDFAYEWNTELFLFTESSNVNVQDGSIFWQKNNVVISDGNDALLTRTTERPQPNETVFQTEVSNGAALGVRSFYDYVLVDDSHYFVLIRNEVSGRFVVLPVISWSASEIKALDIGLESEWTQVEVYKDGVLEGSVSR
jgi:hypothetical protein